MYTEPDSEYLYKEETMPRLSRVLLLITVTLFCVSCSGKKQKSVEKAPVPVKAVQAVQKNVPMQIKAIGNVEAVTSVAVKAQISGQIAKLHFVEGVDVEKGALLVSIDPEPFQASLSQAEANLAKNQAQEKYANDQVKRYEQLLKDGIVTRDQYEMLHSNAKSLAAAVAADKAAVRSARIQLGYCSIRSPISGRTGTVSIQPGNLVKANELPIVTVNQISPISVSFSLPEKRLAEVKRAIASGKVKLEAAIPGEVALSETGSVNFLDNAINPATGTIRLKGIFTNKNRKLWPGQFTDIIITLSDRQNAVVVPTTAIQSGQQGEYVFIVKADSSVEMRPVTFTTLAGEETIIENGVAAGETVVVSGQLRLTPGAKVNTKERPDDKVKSTEPGKKP